MPLPRRKAVFKPLLMGVNDNTNILSIRDDQANRVQNFHIDENGVAYSRGGSNVQNTTALSGAITSIYDFRRPSGSGTASILLVTAGTWLYKWNTSTLVFDAIQELSTSTRPTWATFQDSNAVSYAILANGTDFIKYNGSAVTNVSAAAYPWTDNPRYIMAYDDRMLASGCDSDPYKVFVSDTLDCTDWLPGAGATAVYWTVKGQKGDRVLGLGTIYNFALFFQQFGVTLINEADPDSTTSVQRQVSSQYGTTSHWSIVTIGDYIYFAGQNHIYIGMLREAIEEGLVVREIDDNIHNLYKEVNNATDIVSVYDPVHNEILWGIETRAYGKNNYSIVYNLKRSSPADKIHVWSGWFSGTGYEPYTLGSVKTSTGDIYVYRGDESGYVYIMEESTQYKDETVAATVITEKNIPYEITTAAVMPYGLGITKRARQFYPYLSQRYDASTKLQWIVDSRFIGPDTDQYVTGPEPGDEQYVTLYNRVPFWSAGTQTKTSQTWGSTLYGQNAVMPRPVSINEGFQYIQFKIINVGSNAKEHLTYGGGELWYQVHRLRRTAG